MPEPLNLIADVQGVRLDSFLAAALPQLSRSRLKKLIDDGAVTVEGKAVKASAKVTSGARVRVELPPPEPAEALPEDIPLRVIHEDRWLVAVEKPQGLVVHPAPGHRSGTLVNALLHRCSDLSGVGGVLRPGIVHRLDKDTSGVLLVAKDDATHRALQAAFQSREVEKTYLAVVLGTMEGHGVIDAPIGRHPTERKKMAAGVAGGRDARTRWKALAALKGATLLAVRIETGRTHQIRVHLASAGHPVAGDPLYGGAARAKGLADPLARKMLSNLTGQALHAWKIAFTHPATGERLRLTAEPPPGLLRLVAALGGSGWEARYAEAAR